MELSIKMTSAMIIALIAAGGAVAQFILWQETSHSSVEQATAFYQEEKVDVNTYVHGMQFPQIEVENQRIRLKENFDPRSWVKILDAQDGDITSAVEIYGDVDTSVKGEYELRYVVRNSFGLKSSKRIKVIVD